ncbi:MAG: hypothetical protein ONB48_06500 [candidate division KSB1 bacterium]|nr:hypothetical protein [candidate division KSB1 bacterium]MDZ7273191.1 hypothetical protein [candidate division KSB1 bacterium]MDZ7285293.1 hypothetical protein [candidate division KSB1 bacterium]MDZ7298325.1 hypothetical protein [candidate division KSB1 bacterium]MDZ7307401.1 hypothetical protein [candidate division KSB1 bacterium]
MHAKTLRLPPAAAWLDELFCRGMQMIARRQERQFPPLPATAPPGAQTASLFPPVARCRREEVRRTAWQRQGRIWRCELAFPSALASAWPENNTVFVRTFAPQPDLSLPAVIVVHGLMSLSTLAYRPFLQAIVAAGAAAHFIELPYHHRRTPAGSFSGDLFYTANFELTWQAARQAIADIRRLTHGLRAGEAPVTGILGFSLGAWLAALTICGEPELDFALLAMPPASFNDLVWEAALGRRLRMQLERAQWSRPQTAALTARLDPLSYQPLLSRERIEVFAAAHDAIVPLAHVRALQQAWSLVHVHEYAAGHLTIMLSPQFKRDASLALRRHLQQGGRAAAAPSRRQPAAKQNPEPCSPLPAGAPASA